MPFNFGEYEQKATIFIKEVAKELGTPEDYNHASRVIRAVFHGLRDVLTPEESLNLVAQLPMYLKAVYVNDWKLSTFERINSPEDFMDLVVEEAGRTGPVDFGNYDQTKINVQAVFKVMNNYVSEGEVADVKDQLPESVAELWVV